MIKPLSTSDSSLFIIFPVVDLRYVSPPLITPIYKHSTVNQCTIYYKKITGISTWENLGLIWMEIVIVVKVGGVIPTPSGG